MNTDRCIRGHRYREVEIDGLIACKECGFLLAACQDGCGLLTWNTDRIKAELEQQSMSPMSVHSWMVVLVAGLRGVIPSLYDSLVLGIGEEES